MEGDRQQREAEQEAGGGVGRVVHAAVHPAGRDRDRDQHADDDDQPAQPDVPGVPGDDQGRAEVVRGGRGGVPGREARRRRRVVEMPHRRPLAVDEHRGDQEDHRLAGHADRQDHRLPPAVEHQPEDDHGHRGQPDDRRRLAEQRAEVRERLAGRRALLLQPAVQPGVRVGERGRLQDLRDQQPEQDDHDTDGEPGRTNRPPAVPSSCQTVRSPAGFVMLTSRWYPKAGRITLLGRPGGDDRRLTAGRCTATTPDRPSRPRLAPRHAQTGPPRKPRVALPGVDRLRWARPGSRSRRGGRCGRRAGRPARTGRSPAACGSRC